MAEPTPTSSLPTAEEIANKYKDLEGIDSTYAQVIGELVDQRRGRLTPQELVELRKRVEEAESLKSDEASRSDYQEVQDAMNTLDARISRAEDLLNIDYKDREATVFNTKTIEEMYGRLEGQMRGIEEVVLQQVPAGDYDALRRTVLDSEELQTKLEAAAYKAALADLPEFRKNYTDITGRDYDTLNQQTKYLLEARFKQQRQLEYKLILNVDAKSDAIKQRIDFKEYENNLAENYPEMLEILQNEKTLGLAYQIYDTEDPGLVEVVQQVILGPKLVLPEDDDKPISIEEVYQVGATPFVTNLHDRAVSRTEVARQMQRQLEGEDVGLGDLVPQNALEGLPKTAQRLYLGLSTMLGDERTASALDSIKEDTDLARRDQRLEDYLILQSLKTDSTQTDPYIDRALDHILAKKGTFGQYIDMSRRQIAQSYTTRDLYDPQVKARRDKAVASLDRIQSAYQEVKGNIQSELTLEGLAEQTLDDELSTPLNVGITVRINQLEKELAKSTSTEDQDKINSQIESMKLLRRIATESDAIAPYTGVYTLEDKLNQALDTLEDADTSGEAMQLTFGPIIDPITWSTGLSKDETKQMLLQFQSLNTHVREAAGARGDKTNVAWDQIRMPIQEIIDDESLDEKEKETKIAEIIGSKKLDDLPGYLTAYADIDFNKVGANPFQQTISELEQKQGKPVFDMLDLDTASQMRSYALSTNTLGTLVVNFMEGAAFSKEYDIATDTLIVRPNTKSVGFLSLFGVPKEYYEEFAPDDRTKSMIMTAALPLGPIATATTFAALYGVPNIDLALYKLDPSYRTDYIKDGLLQSATAVPGMDYNRASSNVDQILKYMQQNGLYEFTDDKQLEQVSMQLFQAPIAQSLGPNAKKLLLGYDIYKGYLAPSYATPVAIKEQMLAENGKYTPIRDFENTTTTSRTYANTLIGLSGATETNQEMAVASGWMPGTTGFQFQSNVGLGSDFFIDPIDKVMPVTKAVALPTIAGAKGFYVAAKGARATGKTLTRSLTKGLRNGMIEALAQPASTSNGQVSRMVLSMLDTNDVSKSYETLLNSQARTQVLENIQNAPTFTRTTGQIVGDVASVSILPIIGSLFFGPDVMMKVGLDKALSGTMASSVSKGAAFGVRKAAKSPTQGVKALPGDVFADVMQYTLGYKDYYDFRMQRRLLGKRKPTTAPSDAPVTIDDFTPSTQVVTPGLFDTMAQVIGGEAIPEQFLPTADVVIKYMSAGDLEKMRRQGQSPLDPNYNPDAFRLKDQLQNILPQLGINPNEFFDLHHMNALRNAGQLDQAVFNLLNNTKEAEQINQIVNTLGLRKKLAQAGLLTEEQKAILQKMSALEEGSPEYKQLQKQFDTIKNKQIDQMIAMLSVQAVLSGDIAKFFREQLTLIIGESTVIADVESRVMSRLDQLYKNKKSITGEDFATFKKTLSPDERNFVSYYSLFFAPDEAISLQYIKNRIGRQKSIRSYHTKVEGQDKTFSVKQSIPSKDRSIIVEYQYTLKKSEGSGRYDTAVIDEINISNKTADGIVSVVDEAAYQNLKRPVLRYIMQDHVRQNTNVKYLEFSNTNKLFENTDLPIEEGTPRYAPEAFIKKAVEPFAYSYDTLRGGATRLKGLEITDKTVQIRLTELRSKSDSLASQLKTVDQITLTPVKNRYPRQAKEQDLRTIVTDRQDAEKLLATKRAELAARTDMDAEDYQGFQALEEELNQKRQAAIAQFETQKAEIESIPDMIVKKVEDGEIEAKDVDRLQTKYNDLIASTEKSFDDILSQIDQAAEEVNRQRKYYEETQRLQQEIKDIEAEIVEYDKQYASLGGNAELLKTREEDAFTRLAQQSDINFAEIQTRAIADDIQSLISKQTSAKFLAQSEDGLLHYTSSLGEAVPVRLFSSSDENASEIITFDYSVSRKQGLQIEDINSVDRLSISEMITTAIEEGQTIGWLLDDVDTLGTVIQEELMMRLGVQEYAKRPERIAFLNVDGKSTPYIYVNPKATKSLRPNQYDQAATPGALNFMSDMRSDNFASVRSALLDLDEDITKDIGDTILWVGTKETLSTGEAVRGALNSVNGLVRRRLDVTLDGTSSQGIRQVIADLEMDIQRVQRSIDDGILSAEDANIQSMVDSKEQLTQLLTTMQGGERIIDGSHLIELIIPTESQTFDISMGVPNRRLFVEEALSETDGVYRVGLDESVFNQLNTTEQQAVVVNLMQRAAQFGAEDIAFIKATSPEELTVQKAADIASTVKDRWAANEGEKLITERMRMSVPSRGMLFAKKGRYTLPTALQSIGVPKGTPIDQIRNSDIAAVSKLRERTELPDGKTELAHNYVADPNIERIGTLPIKNLDRADILTSIHDSPIHHLILTDGSKTLKEKDVRVQTVTGVYKLTGGQVAESEYPKQLRYNLPIAFVDRIVSLDKPTFYVNTPNGLMDSVPQMLQLIDLLKKRYKAADYPEMQDKPFVIHFVEPIDTTTINFTLSGIDDVKLAERLQYMKSQTNVVNDLRSHINNSRTELFNKLLKSNANKSLEEVYLLHWNEMWDDVVSSQKAWWRSHFTELVPSQQIKVRKTNNIYTKHKGLYYGERKYKGTESNLIGTYELDFSELRGIIGRFNQRFDVVHSNRSGPAGRHADRLRFFYGEQPRTAAKKSELTKFPLLRQLEKSRLGNYLFLDEPYTAASRTRQYNEKRLLPFNITLADIIQKTPFYRPIILDKFHSLVGYANTPRFGIYRNLGKTITDDIASIMQNYLITNDEALQFLGVKTNQVSSIFSYVDLAQLLLKHVDRMSNAVPGELKYSTAYMAWTVAVSSQQLGRITADAFKSKVKQIFEMQPSNAQEAALQRFFAVDLDPEIYIQLYGSDTNELFRSLPQTMQSTVKSKIQTGKYNPTLSLLEEIDGQRFIKTEVLPLIWASSLEGRARLTQLDLDLHEASYRDLMLGRTDTELNMPYLLRDIFGQSNMVDIENLKYNSTLKTADFRVLLKNMVDRYNKDYVTGDIYQAMESLEGDFKTNFGGLGEVKGPFFSALLGYPTHVVLDSRHQNWLLGLHYLTQDAVAQRKAHGLARAQSEGWQPNMKDARSLKIADGITYDLKKRLKEIDTVSIEKDSAYAKILFDRQGEISDALQTELRNIKEQIESVNHPSMYTDILPLLDILIWEPRYADLLLHQVVWTRMGNLTPESISQLNMQVPLYTMQTADNFGAMKVREMTNLVDRMNYAIARLTETDLRMVDTFTQYFTYIYQKGLEPQSVTPRQITFIKQSLDRMIVHHNSIKKTPLPQEVTNLKFAIDEVYVSVTKDTSPGDLQSLLDSIKESIPTIPPKDADTAPVAPFVTLFGENKSGFFQSKDGKPFINIKADAPLSTFFHEHGHLFEFLLGREHYQNIAKEFDHVKVGDGLVRLTRKGQEEVAEEITNLIYHPGAEVPASIASARPFLSIVLSKIPGAESLANRLGYGELIGHMAQKVVTPSKARILTEAIVDATSESLGIPKKFVVGEPLKPKPTTIRRNPQMAFQEGKAQRAATKQSITLESLSKEDLIREMLPSRWEAFNTLDAARQADMEFINKLRTEGLDVDDFINKVEAIRRGNDFAKNVAGSEELLAVTKLTLIPKRQVKLVSDLSRQYLESSSMFGKSMDEISNLIQVDTKNHQYHLSYANNLSLSTTPYVFVRDLGVSPGALEVNIRTVQSGPIPTRISNRLLEDVATNQGDAKLYMHEIEQIRDAVIDNMIPLGQRRQRALEAVETTMVQSFFKYLDKFPIVGKLFKEGKNTLTKFFTQADLIDGVVSNQLRDAFNSNVQRLAQAEEVLRKMIQETKKNGKALRRTQSEFLRQMRRMLIPPVMVKDVSQVFRLHKKFSSILSNIGETTNPSTTVLYSKTLDSQNIAEFKSLLNAEDQIRLADEFTALEQLAAKPEMLNNPYVATIIEQSIQNIHNALPDEHQLKYTPFLLKDYIGESSSILSQVEALLLSQLDSVTRHDEITTIRRLKAYEAKSIGDPQIRAQIERDIAAMFDMIDRRRLIVEQYGRDILGVATPQTSVTTQTLFTAYTLFYTGKLAKSDIDYVPTYNQVYLESKPPNGIAWVIDDLEDIAIQYGYYDVASNNSIRLNSLQDLLQNFGIDVNDLKTPKGIVDAANTIANGNSVSTKNSMTLFDLASDLRGKTVDVVYNPNKNLEDQFDPAGYLMEMYGRLIVLDMQKDFAETLFHLHQYGDLRRLSSEAIIELGLDTFKDGAKFEQDVIDQISLQLTGSTLRVASDDADAFVALRPYDAEVQMLAQNIIRSSGVRINTTIGQADSFVNLILPDGSKILVPQSLENFYTDALNKVAPVGKVRNGDVGASSFYHLLRAQNLESERLKRMTTIRERMTDAIFEEKLKSDPQAQRPKKYYDNQEFINNYGTLRKTEHDIQYIELLYRQSGIEPTPETVINTVIEQAIDNKTVIKRLIQQYDESKNFFTQVSRNIEAKQLDISNFIKELVRPSNFANSGFLRMFKQNVTIGSWWNLPFGPTLAYMFGNTIGAISQLFIGAGPERIQSMASVVARNPQFYAAVMAESASGLSSSDMLGRVMVTKDGRILTSRQMYNMMREYGVGSSFVTAELGRAVIEELYSATRNKLELTQKIDRGLLSSAEALDNIFRISLFMSLIDDGMPYDAAAREVRRVMFDYTELSEFEKHVMRTIITFYSFQRKNFGLMAEELARNPNRVLGQLRLVKASQRQQVTEGYDEIAINKFYQTRLFLPTGSPLYSYMKSEQGSYVVNTDHLMDHPVIRTQVHDYLVYQDTLGKDISDYKLYEDKRVLKRDGTSLNDLEVATILQSSTSKPFLLDDGSVNYAQFEQDYDMVEHIIGTGSSNMYTFQAYKEKYQDVGYILPMLNAPDAFLLGIHTLNVLYRSKRGGEEESNAYLLGQSNPILQAFFATTSGTAVFGLRDMSDLTVPAEVVHHPMMAGVFAYEDEPELIPYISETNEAFPYIGKKVRVVPDYDRRALAGDRSTYVGRYRFKTVEDAHRYQYYQMVASFLPMFGRSQTQSMQVFDNAYRPGYDTVMSELNQDHANVMAGRMIDMTPVGYSPQEYWLRVLGVRRIPIITPDEQERRMIFESLKRLPEEPKVKTDEKFVTEQQQQSEIRRQREAAEYEAEQERLRTFGQ